MLGGLESRQPPGTAPREAEEGAGTRLLVLSPAQDVVMLVTRHALVAPVSPGQWAWTPCAAPREAPTCPGPVGGHCGSSVTHAEGVFLPLMSR